MANTRIVNVACNFEGCKQKFITLTGYLSHKRMHLKRGDRELPSKDSSLNERYGSILTPFTFDKSVTVQLGQEVMDLVTGYKGIVTNITTFIHGCKRIGITRKFNPQHDTSGEEYALTEVFDEQGLKVLSNGYYLPPEEQIDINDASQVIAKLSESQPIRQRAGNRRFKPSRFG